MKHFLSMDELTGEGLQELLNLAVALKSAWRAGGNEPILRGKSLALVFQKPSLRTRVSYEMGMVHLGGYGLMLSPQEVGMGTRESAADVARVLSGYVDGVMARVFEHELLEELAAYATVPVINGLSDYNHPSQTLADLLTIYEEVGKLAGVRVVYVGDGNNVARSLLFGAMLAGMRFGIATPAGYGLKDDDFETAERLRWGEASFEVFESADTAVAQADIIYTDVWTSMGQEAERERREKVFPPFQVNGALMAKAPAGAKVMHCLPAHRGEEITHEVVEGSQAVMFAQAANRLHAQKAVLARLLG